MRYKNLVSCVFQSLFSSVLVPLSVEYACYQIWWKLVFLVTLLPYFQVLPFADILFQYYIFSRIMSIIINGITNIIFSLLIIKKKNRHYLSNYIWIHSDDVDHYSVCYLSIIHNQSGLFFVRRISAYHRLYRSCIIQSIFL